MPQPSRSLESNVSTLQSLLDERRKLEGQIQQVRGQDRSLAIKHVLEVMDAFGLKVVDVDIAHQRRMAALKKGADPVAEQSHRMKGQKLPAKYRNKQTGESWAGRGVRPRWLVAALKAGRKLEDFTV